VTISHDEGRTLKHYRPSNFSRFVIRKKGVLANGRLKISLSINK